MVAIESIVLMLCVACLLHLIVKEGSLAGARSALSRLLQLAIFVVGFNLAFPGNETLAIVAGLLAVAYSESTSQSLNFFQEKMLHGFAVAGIVIALAPIAGDLSGFPILGFSTTDWVILIVSTAGLASVCHLITIGVDSRAALLIVAGAGIIFVFRSMDVGSGISTTGLLVLAGTCILYLPTRISSTATDNSLKPELAWLVSLLLFASLASYFLKGYYASAPGYLIVYILAAILSLWYFLAPYQGAVRRVADFVWDFDTFIRFHYYGFPSTLVILGALSGGTSLKVGTIAALLLIAIMYNLYAYVQNDVIDLPVDLTQPKRQRDPIVRGSVTSVMAMMIALGMYPASLLVTYLAGAPAICYWLISYAYLGMAIYNLYGKRIAVPPITDFIEATAWASLALYGAAYAGVAINSSTLLAFGYGVGFIFLINGVHGGLRDLVNDTNCNKKTTSIFLGATFTDGGVVVSSRGVLIFAFLVLAYMDAIFIAMFLQSFAAPWTLSDTITALLLATTIAWSGWLMYEVVKPISPHRDDRLAVHLFALTVPPVIIYASRVEPVVSVALATSFFFPLVACDPTLSRLRNLLCSREESKRLVMEGSEGQSHG